MEDYEALWVSDTPECKKHPEMKTVSPEVDEHQVLSLSCEPGRGMPAKQIYDSGAKNEEQARCNTGNTARRRLMSRVLVQKPCSFGLQKR